MALLQKWTAYVALIVGAVLSIYFKGFRRGQRVEQDKLGAATNKVHKDFNEIDNTDLSVRDALDGLRKRSDANRN